MIHVTLPETVLLIAASIATGIMVAFIPRTWREYRWARAHGDPDERRIGRSVWWGHLAACAGSLSFVSFSARLLLIEWDGVRRPGFVIVSSASAFVCCVLLLVSQLHMSRRSRGASPNIHYLTVDPSSEEAVND